MIKVKEENIDPLLELYKCPGNGEVFIRTAAKPLGGDVKLADRHNTGKSQLSMILEAKHALEGLAGVLSFGAVKYARGNWHKGLPHADICDSLLRHLSAYLAGEDLDPESGKPHVDHVFCNAMFLAEGFRTHPELDNRSEELRRGK